MYNVYILQYMLYIHYNCIMYKHYNACCTRNSNWKYCIQQCMNSPLWLTLDNSCRDETFLWKRVYLSLFWTRFICIYGFMFIEFKHAFVKIGNLKKRCHCTGREFCFQGYITLIGCKVALEVSGACGLSKAYNSDWWLLHIMFARACYSEGL